MYRPERHVKRRCYGKYRGEVVEDDNKAPGERRPGRVTVLVKQVDPKNQMLAEPCFPQGSLYVPAVGDKVWVEFEEGDPTKAIWTGILYPKDDARPKPEGASAPPDKLEADPKQIWTRSGHVITIDDEEQTLAVTFAESATKKSEITIGGDGIVLQCGQTSVAIKAGSIELKSGKGHVVLDASGTRIEWLEQLKLHVHPSPMGPTGQSPDLPVLPQNP
jgi:hypothetical protein